MGKKKVKEPDGPPKDEFDAVELITKKPQTVVLMLQSNEEILLQTVCDALYKYSEKAPENKSQLLTFGALEYLVKLLKHEDKVVKRNASMCIGSIASEVSARRLLRKFGCIPLLLLLLGPEEEIICHEFGTLALSWLAEDYVSKNEIFDKQGIPLLIQHLQSSDCDVQKNSVRAVGLMLADFQCRAVFKHLNGVEPLLKLLDSEYPVIQDLSLTALIACSQDSECKSAIREFNGLTKLVEIIGDESMVDLHISCLKCLSSCLHDPECLKMIQSTGVFDKLLLFIADSTNLEVQHFATSVIAAACRKEDNRKVFHEQDTEKTLLSLLSSESIAVNVAALKALAFMAEHLSSRDKIGKLDGVPLILPYLRNDNMEAREYATLALANLTTSNAPNCQMLMDKNAIDHVIKLLYDKSSSCIKSNSALCLSNLALNESWRSDLAKHGTVKGLINAMQSDDTNVQIRSCQTLATFACDVESRSQLLIEKGLSRLIELVESNYESVRRNASWVIALCATDKLIADEITKCGGLDVLQTINLSSRSNPLSTTALDRLLDSNLSAKYALNNVLTFDNIIDDVFYDTGKICAGDTFKTLEELGGLEVNEKRPIILIPIRKAQQNISKEASVKTIPQVQTPKPADKTTDRSRSKNKNDDKTNLRRGSRAKGKIERDDSKERSTEETIQEVPPVVKTGEPRVDKSVYKIPLDKRFVSYVNTVENYIAQISTIDEQIQALANFVSDEMGGNVSKESLSSFSYELHMSEMKTQLRSNIVPIGSIKRGIYYHRALLFKVLCDLILIPCSLVRGDYGRAWNEVQLCRKDDNGDVILPPVCYIVDLMHQPGDLLNPGTPQALSYQRI